MVQKVAASRVVCWERTRAVAVQAMAEQVIASLCAEESSVRALPLTLVRAWPNAAVLDLVLAIATGCDAIDSMFGTTGPCGIRAREGWQMAALIATDLRAMQALGLPCDSARDLLAYWRAHDGFFLHTDAVT